MPDRDDFDRRLADAAGATAQEVDTLESLHGAGCLATGTAGGDHAAVSMIRPAGVARSAATEDLLSTDDVSSPGWSTSWRTDSDFAPGRRRMVGDARPSTSSTQVARAFSRLWELPLHASDDRGILRSVTDVCRDAFPAASWVSITIGPPSQPDVLVTDGIVTQRLEGIQLQVGEGPCQDAWQAQVPMISQDLETDARWPRFGRLATGTGARSALSLPILLGADRLGGLNLYSATPAAFHAADARIGELFASAVAALLKDVRTQHELKDLVAQLETALSTRGPIDQAKGIVMARRRCSADEAFAYLVKLSSNTNIKVREVARQLIEQTVRGC
jgi:GAF domain-containing protein